MNKFFTAFFLLFALAFGASTAAAEEDSIYTGLFNNRAVSGYDTVAYFTAGKPVKGKKAFKTSYMDAEWRFSSQDNLDAFLADPAKYAPQYGGYCAWAIGRGYTASGDPKQWKIVDGKLYLNYDAKIKKKWEADIPYFIKLADQIYPGIVGLKE